MAIINIQLHIQASYYDNQNNRGRDEKKQFRGNEGITLSTALKCFRMWIQPVRVFTRFSQTFDEVEMPTRSSVQEQHLREVVFRVEFVLHNRLFQRQFIFVDAICLLQAALSCLEYVFLQAALSCLEYVFLQAALSCLEYVSCNLVAVHYHLFAFFTFRFELLLSSDICAECDM